ncbi:MAG: AsnC family transcriptional regulator, partial [Thermoleophilia bacterium]|nr:AsnC family transcriptional regulator [Thermoleophilia bacterium]
MAVHLDTTDRHIIALLVEDGRLSSAEIARRIGHVSERSVRYRIGRLRRTGVMRVTAIVSPQALGYTTIGDISISVLPGTLQDVAARPLSRQSQPHSTTTCRRRDSNPHGHSPTVF